MCPLFWPTGRLKAKVSYQIGLGFLVARRGTARVDREDDIGAISISSLNKTHEPSHEPTAAAGNLFSSQLLVCRTPTR